MEISLHIDLNKKPFKIIITKKTTNRPQIASFHFSSRNN